MGLVRSYLQFKLALLAAGVLAVAAALVGSAFGASGTWAVVVGAVVVVLAVLASLFVWARTR